MNRCIGCAGSGADHVKCDSQLRVERLLFDLVTAIESDHYAGVENALTEFHREVE